GRARRGRSDRLGRGGCVGGREPHHGHPGVRGRGGNWEPVVTAAGPAGEGIPGLAPDRCGCRLIRLANCEVTLFTEFRDRAEGGRLLAEKLADWAGRSDVLVLALPRGGVPVGFEVARALESPLDVLVVRKLGVPGDEELAMGAIASGGARVLNDEV